MMGHNKSLIYANNAMTSWPKPDGVAEAMVHGLACTGSIGRGSGSSIDDADRLVQRARNRCARFLGAGDPNNLMFVPSATIGLNMVLQGALKPGDAVVVARAEHNAVLRPLHALERRGVTLAWVPMVKGGYIDLAELECLLKVGVDQGRPFKAVVCRHGSNASGALQPIEDVVMLAHQFGAAVLSDGAQVAGDISVNLDEIGVDAWVCSGHKGLLGPKGIGLMYLADGFNPDPLIWGGTGSGDADDLCDDHIRPTCYEPGTEALPAILGLEAGVEWLEQNPEASTRMRALGSELRERLRAIEGIRVLGPGAPTASGPYPQLPLVPIVSEKIATPVFGAILGKEYGIIARTGMHCSPDAAKVLGVYPQGSVRLSLGPFSTSDEVDAIVAAVTRIVK